MLQFLDFLAKTPQIDKVHDRTDNTAVFEYVSLAVGNFNKIRCSRKFGFVFVRQKLADSFRQPGIKTFIGNSAINNADFDFRRKSRNLGKFSSESSSVIGPNTSASADFRLNL